MGTRRVGANWFDSAVSFNDFISAPHAYYAIGAGADVDLGEISTVSTYQSAPHPVTGATLTLYQGAFNGAIPAGAVGDNVVLKIYDPLHPELALEYDAIDVCTDVAVSVTVSPAVGSVRIGGTIQFTATYLAADGLPTDDPGTTWSTDASGPAEGSINSGTGLFTAGTDAGGPYTVTATAGALSDSSIVSVTAFISRPLSALNVGVLV